MIVHIGYPKTGSSYLQAVVFPNLRNIHYTHVRPSVALFDELLYRDDTEYSVDGFREHQKAIGNDLTQLYSLEQLVGRPFHDNGGNRSRSCKRLMDLGAGKVIITLRSQYSIIDSMYRDYVRQGGVLTFLDFFHSNHYAQRDYFLVQYLNYYKVIELYKKQLGEENILILLFEELKTDKQNVVSKISKFCNAEFVEPASIDLEVNTSLSNFSTSLMRISNHFSCNHFKPSNLISNKISSGKFRYLFSRVDKLGFKKHNYLSKEIREVVGEKYKDGNKAIEQEFNVNLSKFNYPL